MPVRPSFVPIIALSILVAANAGCGVLGSQVDRETTAGSAATVSTDESGVTKGKISKDQGGEFTASGTGAAGSRVLIPPGALGVDTQVSIDEGVAPNLTESLGELGITDGDAAAAGPAVVFESSVETDATEPMTLAIPLNSAAGLTATSTAVLFVVRKSSEGSSYIGIIPPNQVETKENKLVFRTKFFGLFQAITVSVEIEEVKEAKTTETIVRKASAGVADGFWLGECTEEKDDRDDDSSEDGGAQYELERWSINGERATITAKTYEKAGCEGTPSHASRLPLKFELGAELPSPEGARELTATVEGIFLAFFNDKAIEVLNDNSGCGRTDWQLGRFQDVSGCDLDKAFGSDEDSSDDNSGDNGEGGEGCPDGGPPAKGEKVYTVVRILDNKLHLPEHDENDCDDGASPDNRESFDAGEVVLTKQL